MGKSLTSRTKVYNRSGTNMGQKWDANGIIVRSKIWDESGIKIGKNVISRRDQKESKWDQMGSKWEAHETTVRSKWDHSGIA